VAAVLGHGPSLLQAALEPSSPGAAALEPSCPSRHQGCLRGLVPGRSRHPMGLQRLGESRSRHPGCLRKPLPTGISDFGSLESPSARRFLTHRGSDGRAAAVRGTPWASQGRGAPEFLTCGHSKGRRPVIFVTWGGLLTIEHAPRPCRRRGIGPAASVHCPAVGTTSGAAAAASDDASAAPGRSCAGSERTGAAPTPASKRNCPWRRRCRPTRSALSSARTRPRAPGRLDSGARHRGASRRDKNVDPKKSPQQPD
jgi:hypothetical protein